MAEIDRLLKVTPATKLPRFTDRQIAEFLRQECKDFCDPQGGDLEFAARKSKSAPRN